MKLKVSARVVEVAAKDAPRERRMQAALGKFPLSGKDQVLALFLLARGSDRDIREAAVGTFRELPVESLAAALSDEELPPQLLEFILRVRNDSEVVGLLVNHPALPEELRCRIAATGTGAPDSPKGEIPLPPEERTSSVPEGEEEREGSQPEEDDEPEEEVNLSKYQQSLEMGVADKIKYALTGDKEWRAILIKEANKLVCSAVMKNPRITEGEVAAVARNRSSNEELIRMILLNQEWTKNYEIQRALVHHPRTPLPKALRFMNNLTEKDIKQLAKSRNVSAVLVNNARRILMAKDKRK